jgi:hypothetical protein
MVGTKPMPPITAEKPTSRPSIPCALASLLLALYLLTASGHLYLGDAWGSLHTAESLLTRGQLDIAFDGTSGGKFGPDGKFYAQYGVGVMLHDLGPAAAGRLLSKDMPAGPARNLMMGLPASLLNIPFTVATAILFYLLAIRLGYDERTAVAATLALALGTTLWPYAKYDACEPQLTTAAFLAIYLLVARPVAGCLAAGVALGWALLVKLQAVLFLPPILFYLWRTTGNERRRAAACLMVGPGIAIGLILAYDWIRFGSLLETGYSASVQGETIPVLIGLYGLLLSAGKGVVFFSPALLFALFGHRRFRERDTHLYQLVLFTTALHVIFFALQQNWDGDWCWGPRYLIPCLPLLMLLALPFFEAPPSGPSGPALIASVAATALVVQLLAVAVDPRDYIRLLSDQKAVFGDFLKKPQKVYIPLHVHHFNPDLSPLRGHLWLLSTLYDRARGQTPAGLYLSSSVEELSDRGGHRLEERLTLKAPTDTRLDFWLLIFGVMAAGRPGPTMLVWCCFAANVMLLLRARRQLRRALRQGSAPSSPPPTVPVAAPHPES